MTQKRHLNDEKITLENIREELSSDFKAIFEELQKKLYAESKYKRLKRVGEEQFSNAALQSNVEMENQNTRLAFAEINLLQLEVLKNVETFVAEQFQGSFLSSMKDNVKKAILKLYSEKKNDAQIAFEDYKISSIASGCSDGDEEDEIVILERLKDLSKFCADNLIDIRNQVIGMPREENEIGPTLNPKEEISGEIKVEKLDSDIENPQKNVSSEMSCKMKKMNNAAADSKKIILNESRVENLDSATINSKKTFPSENKAEKLDNATSNPRKTMSKTKVKKLKSATTTSKKEISHESKVKKLKSATTSTENSTQCKVEEPKTKSNIDAGNLSGSDSVSSVHTSDLSSFDDEIVFSSDEETGEKRRRMSIKEVEARLAELKAKKLAAENQIKSSEHEDTSESEMNVNESLSISRKSLSQRVRKPNSKYITDVIQIPMRKSSVEKDTALSHVSSVDPLPRKRGRPRKHHNSLE